jgi:hypothetical protein
MAGVSVHGSEYSVSKEKNITFSNFWKGDLIKRI